MPTETPSSSDSSAILYRVYTNGNRKPVLIKPFPWMSHIFDWDSVTFDKLAWIGGIQLKKVQEH